MPEETEAPEDLGIGPQPAAADDTPAPGDATAPLLTGDDDTAPDEPSSEAEETGPPAFDWKTVDLRRVKIEDAPEDVREALEHLQKQYKDAQRVSGRTAADLQRQQEALAERERLLAEREAEVTPTQAPESNTAGKVADMLDDPNIDADTRNALMTVKKMMDEELETRLAPYKPLLERFPEMQDAVGSIAEKEQAADRDALFRQYDEAVNLYDSADIDTHSDGIARLLGRDGAWNPISAPLTNPATGEPHTVLSAYELLSGETKSKAEAARAEDAVIRNDARKNASELTAVGSPPGEPFSEADARVAIRNLGFGRS